jgi:ribosomal protein S18 acetylase RimI-like enzyme
MQGMNQPHIRLLTALDADSYLALRLCGLNDHPEAFTSSYAEELQRSTAWAVKRLALDAARPHDFFLGAFMGDALCGVVGLQGRYRTKERHNATVVGMVVAPQVRGRGVGRALMDALLQKAATLPELVQLDLTVTEGNPAAQRLYEHCGFQTFGVHQRAICVAGVYHAKVHMALQLPPAA